MSIRHQGAGTCVAALMLGLGLIPSLPASAAEPPQAGATLRICAAADELPYSDRNLDGFENKIATALAKAMKRKPEFVFSAKPAIYLVSELLNVKRCDVVMGLDAGDERVLTSKPYYRAPYVFIERKDSPLTITSWKSPDLAKADKIGFTPGSPAQVMLEETGLFNQNFNYMHSLTNFQDRRNKFTRIPPQRMVGEVANGTADLAVNFAPEVARYVKGSANLKLVVIPDDNVRSNGTKVPHHFDQSIGVRKDDAKLLAEVNAALEGARADVEGILQQEGIPLLPTAPRS